MSPRTRQEGATLLVTMIMLLIFTIFTLTTVNSSTVNLKVVGNMQAKKQVETDTQQALEQVLSSVVNFTTPAAQTITGSYSTVTVPAPACLRETDVPGYFMTSASQPSLAPKDQLWEVRASGQDTVTGAVAVLTQGVKIRQPVGSNCP